jgi:hypothetical protein
VARSCDSAGVPSIALLLRQREQKPDSCDVQCGDNLLLALCRRFKLLLVLEWLVELLREIFALPVVVREVGFAFFESLFETAECVLYRRDGA